MAAERNCGLEASTSTVAESPFPGCYILEEINPSPEAVLRHLKTLRNLLSPKNAKILDEVMEYKADLDEPLTPVR